MLFFFFVSVLVSFVFELLGFLWVALVVLGLSLYTRLALNQVVH